jgi:DNA-binding response OmpR family regulator
MRILVVEDEKKLAKFIRRALREDGHAVDVCNDGEVGSHFATSEEYDAIILDLMLPERDGLSILRDLRETGKTTPVLILTARDTVKDRVKGLDMGADDYLAKPFALEELRARIRALLRRRQPGAATKLQFGDLSVSLIDRVVSRGSRKIHLTNKEFALLEYFMRSPRQVLTRTSIAEHVWDYNFEYNSNVVDVFVNSLRRKLESGGEARLIQTVRGIGYVLREKDE